MRGTKTVKLSTLLVVSDSDKYRPLSWKDQDHSTGIQTCQSANRLGKKMVYRPNRYCDKDGSSADGTGMYTHYCTYILLYYLLTNGFTKRIHQTAFQPPPDFDRNCPTRVESGILTLHDSNGYGIRCMARSQ